MNKEETEDAMAIIAIALAFVLGCALGYFFSFVLIKIFF